MQYYEISYEGVEFGVSVRSLGRSFRGEEQMYYIEVGGREKCIDMSVTKNNPKAYISGFKHHKRCAMTVDLPTGDDGTVKMLRAAMTFVSKKFKYVQYFQLRDTSYIQCRYKLRTDLWSLYLVKHRTTWYASKVHAHPDVDANNKYIQDINDFLDDNTVKREMLYNDFFERHVAPVLMTDSILVEKNIDKPEFVSNMRQVMRPLYDSADTLRDFCLRIDAEFPKQCIVFYKWLTGLLKSVSNIPIETMDWNISMEDVPERPIQITKRDTTSFIKKRPTFDIMNTIDYTSRGGCKCGTKTTPNNTKKK